MGWAVHHWEPAGHVGVSIDPQGRHTYVELSSAKPAMAVLMLCACGAVGVTVLGAKVLDDAVLAAAGR